MVVRGILEAGPRTEPGGSKLIGQNEDLHPSTARQNHLLQYCLINYDVKLASLIPSSDIHPQKVSMEFVKLWILLKASQSWWTHMGGTW